MNAVGNLTDDHKGDIMLRPSHVIIVTVFLFIAVAIMTYAVSDNRQPETSEGLEFVENQPLSTPNGGQSSKESLLRTQPDRVTISTDSPRSQTPPNMEQPEGWTQWRGPQRDGVSTETGLLTNWPEGGPPLAWRTTGLGQGMSSITISGDYLFTLGKKGGRCQIHCRKLSDGSQVWSTPIGGNEPNCTPTIDPIAKLIFGLTFDGDLSCIKMESGELEWRKNFGRDFGGKMMSGWGYSESPLVDSERLICTPGGPDAVIVALDKKNGETIWKAKQPSGVGGNGNDGAGYSSVVISRGGGVKQYVQLTGRGLISVAAEDGRTLWTYNRIANNVANIPTSIVKDDYVFCSSGYGTGAALLKLTKQGRRVHAEEVYFQGGDRLQNHHGGMVLLRDHLYLGHGHNNGFPVCVEFLTGKIVWGGRIRGPGRGSAAVVCADGHLYFRYEDATMALIEATPKDYHLKATFRIASKNGKSWSHPVIHKGRLYLRDQDELLCYKIDRSPR